MPTRILIGGRTAWVSRDMPRPQPLTVPRNRAGEVLDDLRIPPSSADSLFRAGSAYYDHEDGVEYRAVGATTLDPRDGWRTADFWLDRWGIVWKDLRAVVLKGWLDPAIEVGGATKRFRCRDEERVLAWIREQKVASVSSRTASTKSSSVAKSARSR